MVLSLLSVLLLTLFAEIGAVPFALDEVRSTYVDDELEELWTSLSDLYFPTLADYQLVQNYLRYGRRPYLDTLFDLCLGICEIFPEELGDRSFACWQRIQQNIKLVGPKQEMPVFKQMELGGAHPEDKSRCIVLYGSFNMDPFDLRTSYAQRMLNIVADLKREGYVGHVLYRVGGYPLVDRGSLRLIHVPYSFKLLSLIEASLMGYHDVLWVDCSMHPANNLKKVFLELRRKGVILATTDTKLDYEYRLHLCPDSTVFSTGLRIADLAKIPHIGAAIIGISFNHPSGHELLREWYRMTAMVHPAMSLYPEEFILSIAAWRCGIKPTNRLANYMDTRECTPQQPSGAKLPFWMDKK